MLSGSLLLRQYKATCFYFLGLAGNLYCLPIPSAAVAGSVLLFTCDFAPAKKAACDCTWLMALGIPSSEMTPFSPCLMRPRGCEQGSQVRAAAWCCPRHVACPPCLLCLGHIPALAHIPAAVNGTLNIAAYSNHISASLPNALQMFWGVTNA